MMTLRCDHCRGKLGRDVHRYWHMRFCSTACERDYQRRLGDETRAKIRSLDAIAGAPSSAFRASLASRVPYGLHRRVAG